MNRVDDKQQRRNLHGKFNQHRNFCKCIGSVFDICIGTVLYFYKKCKIFKIILLKRNSYAYTNFNKFSFCFL